jgi:glycosyltransferase involved in cell wall biosynthesis
MTRKNINILILGKIPPPIGGVTIHTSRLLDLCDKENFEYTFYDLSNFEIRTFIRVIRRSKIAHIHANNPLLLFLFSFACFIYNTYSILTIHGNINSYNTIMSLFEVLAISFVKKPILLNSFSLKKAKKFNKNSIMISSFIPPLLNEGISRNHLSKIVSIKQKANYVFCTNASDLVYDKFGNEVYGILPLIDFFNNNPNLGLLISDPKSSYKNYIHNNNIAVNPNIILLTGKHSFFEIIKKSNCVIRNTSKDGDSLSIKEALYLNIPVIATNCVDRPKGVELIEYGSQQSLSNGITNLLNNFSKNRKNEYYVENGGIELIKMYTDLIDLLSADNTKR